MNVLNDSGGNISEIKTSIAPWISVADGLKAVTFYKHAFNAVETYKLEAPDGSIIARLSVDGVEFWISGSVNVSHQSSPAAGDTVRMILTVSNPQSIFEQAVKAGATVVFPVAEGHGWLLGRIVDPFGLHWEIGHQLRHEV